MERVKVLLRKPAIALAVALAVVVTIAVAVAAIPHSTGAQAPDAITEQLDGWIYSAGQGENAIEVTVRYDVSAQGIQKFVAANRQLVNQLSGPVEATIVFQRPLSIAEFQDVVQKNGVQVKRYTMRAIDQAGIRITMQGAPDGNVLVPQGTLDGMLNNLNRQTTGVTFKGIVSVDVVASQAQLMRLLADPRVYITDVTQAIAAERARPKIAAKNAAAAQLPIHTHQYMPLYWFMENAGIAPK